MKIEQNKQLIEFNTLGLPCQAEWYVEAANDLEICEALRFAQDKKLSVRPLGSGSNIVLGRKLPGLIIRSNCQTIQITAESSSAVTIEVAAGMQWHALVRHCLTRGWHGLENLALIPGSVGAAPIQNIGAYGVELSQYCRGIKGYSLDQNEIILTAQDCGFAYRDSRFKQDLKGQLVISSVLLELSKQKRMNTEYPALAAKLGDGATQASPQQVFDAVVSIRKQKLPDPKELPNVGSFFKNPVVSADTYHRLMADHPEIVAWQFADGYKLAAGWLLERDGWRGYRDGSIGMHEGQALVLVNYGGAALEQVLSFADRICQSIEKRFAVTLEIEPSILFD